MSTITEQFRRNFPAFFADKERVYKQLFQKFTYRADGDPLPYDPAVNEAQDAFHTAGREGKRYLAMFGGSGLGKSMCAAREAIVHAFKPGATIWLLGADYEAASKEFDYCYEDLVVSGLFGGVGKDGVIVRAVNNKHGDMHIKFKWGAEIIGKSAKEAHKGTLLGEGLDCLVLCEGSRIPGDIFDRYLERAISRRKGTVICNTTPKGKNWVYHKFYQSWREGNPIYWSADPYPAIVNPFYDKTEFERQREELGEDSLEFQEQFLGLFVSYSGLCYPEFAVYGENRHVFDKDPLKDIPESWPRWVVIDPHFSIPHAVGFYTVDRSNCPIIYDELWVKGSADDLVSAIFQKHKEHGAKVMDGKRRWIESTEGLIETTELHALYGGNEAAHIIDTSSVVKSEIHGGTSIRDEIYDAGLRCKLARKEGIFGRILHIKRMLKKRVPLLSGKDGETKPWLTVFKRCHRTTGEFEHSEWEEGGARSDKTPKQARKDKDDHFLNCFEYFIAENPTWDVHERREIFRPSKQRKRAPLDKSVKSGHKGRLSNRSWRTRQPAKAGRRR